MGNDLELSEYGILYHNATADSDRCEDDHWADGLTTPHSRKMEHSGRGDTTLVETAERIKPR